VAIDVLMSVIFTLLLVSEILIMFLMCLTLKLVIQTAKLANNKLLTDWKVISLHIVSIAAIAYVWFMEAYYTFVSINNSCDGLTLS
jgi:quinol-cytochrome oxidoreductase complex cytochrome b subunit